MNWTNIAHANITTADLPLQYYTSTVWKWNQFQSRHHSTYPKSVTVSAALASDTRDKEMARKSRFEKLNPNVVWQCLKHKATFEMESHIALDVVLTNFKVLCEVVGARIGSETIEELRVETPHKIFSWYESDFIERRKVKSLSWLKVFRRQLSPESLEIRKFNHDMEEISRLFELTVLSSQDHKTTGVQLITKAYEFLNIEERLTMEVAKNTEAVRSYLNDTLKLKMSKHTDEPRLQLIAELDATLTSSDVVLPIDYRYRAQYYCLMADQLEDRCSIKEKSLEQEIKALQIKINTEKFSSQCALDALYAETNKFKTRFEEINAKYSSGYENIESDITYKKLSLDKMKAQHTYFKEQILRFHDEIEELRLTEIEERNRALKLARERKELAHAKHAKGHKKKGKRKT